MWVSFTTRQSLSRKPPTLGTEVPLPHTAMLSSAPSRLRSGGIEQPGCSPSPTGDTRSWEDGRSAPSPPLCSTTEKYRITGEIRAAPAPLSGPGDPICPQRSAQRDQNPTSNINHAVVFLSPIRERKDAAIKSVHNNIIGITLFCSLQSSFRSIFPTTGSGSHVKPRPSSSRTCLVTPSQSVPVTTGSYSPQGTRRLRSVCTDLRYPRGFKNP